MTTTAAAGGLALGIDIGGTKVEIALVDASGAVLDSCRLRTLPERGASVVIHEVAAAARSAFGDALGGAAAAGVSVAGQIGADGVVLGAPNLGWAGSPVGAELAAALGLPVVVANDVRAAGWAEWCYGAGRGCTDVVVLFVGTGVGGSAIVDGRILLGAGGIAGEFGHITLVAGGRRCHCRNVGCFEAYASGWAIAERAVEAVRANERAGAPLLRLAGGDPAAITAETVAAARTAGDPLAVRLVEETGAYLGAGLVSLVNAFNPARIILGGGVIEGFAELMPMAAAVVRDRALAAAAGVELVPAMLGVHAPVVGAAALAAREVWPA